MNLQRATRLDLALLVVTIGCGRGEPLEHAPSPVSRGLGEDTVALVGARAINAAAVGKIATAQQITRTAARDIAIRDALFAASAEERRLDGSLDVVMATRALLARSLLRKIHAEAEQAPLTDEELARVSERRWLDVDRPEGFRTVHAVVRFDASAPPEKRARALDLAEALRAAVTPLKTQAPELPAGVVPSGLRRAEDDPLFFAFQKAMEPFTKGNHDGLEVMVEALPAVAADGRVLTPEGQRVDLAFAHAAAALVQRGEVSPIVISSFGAHVIVLLSKTPAVTFSPERRREVLRDDIVLERARAAEDKLLAGLRTGSALVTDADALLALVPIDP